MEKKRYMHPVIEIIPFVSEVFLEGSTTTEDFKKDELDWDDEGSSNANNLQWGMDELVSEPW